MKRKVLFLIESLAGGGAEKVLTTLMQHIDKERFDVMVCAISGGGKYEEEIKRYVKYKAVLQEPFDGGFVARWVYVLKHHLVYKWLPLSWVYRLFLPQGNDVEVAFVEGFATKLLGCSLNKKAKKYAWVHIDLKQNPWTQQSGVYETMLAERATYFVYDSVVCVSHSVENIMRNYYKLQNTCTIYNIVDSVKIYKLSREICPLEINNRFYNIVSVGRLVPQKGYDMLLPIIKALKDAGNKIHLWIVGEGNEEKYLRKQADRLGIENDVSFVGFLNNPYPLMSKMDLFVCSSRSEGFSLVTAEAIILRIPVISMNCSGPNELLRENSLCLCNSYNELYKKIKMALVNKKDFMTTNTSLCIEQIISQIHNLLSDK